MCKLRFGRIERERYETLKTARFVLLLAQTHQMIYAVFDRFDVAIKHRRVCFQTRRMDLAGEFQPATRVALVRANHRARWLAKNLSAAARTRIQAGIDQ